MAGSVRRPDAAASLPPGVEAVIVDELGPRARWTDALRGIDSVIHLAARVHMMRDPAPDPLAEYRHVNVDGTRALVQAAAEAGVRRVVLASSVKALGEGGDAVYTDASTPMPADPYGISKAEAERIVLDEGTRAGIEGVVLRPPVVYGPGVRANVARLMALIDRGLPLPIGRVNNRRSLVFVGNLADAFVRALDHPRAPGHAFLVADGPPLSTPDLVRRLGRALGRPARIFPVPVSWLRFAGSVTGKCADVNRLVESLEVDDAGIRKQLGWVPPFTLDEGLAETARWYLDPRGISP